MYVASQFHPLNTSIHKQKKSVVELLLVMLILNLIVQLFQLGATSELPILKGTLHV